MVAGKVVEAVSATEQAVSMAAATGLELARVPEAAMVLVENMVAATAAAVVQVVVLVMEQVRLVGSMALAMEAVLGMVMVVVMALGESTVADTVEVWEKVLVTELQGATTERATAADGRGIPAHKFPATVTPMAVLCSTTIHLIRAKCTSNNKAVFTPILASLLRYGYVTASLLGFGREMDSIYINVLV
ncbi:hypothetical protein GW17_00062117 [Ensete ventricosum]|nr:hypothetical protein GW17_00062117 [Ensete ventricosum]